MEKPQLVLEKYQTTLLEKGVQATLHRRYFETVVNKRRQHYTTPGFDAIDRAIEGRREEQKYHHQKNRYQVLILRISPVQKGLVEKDRCREYAFWIRKTDRAHAGLAPEAVAYSEETLLRKLKKRLQALCARSLPPEKLCRDTFADLLRYLFSRKYGYKKTVLGLAVLTWDLIFTGVFLAALLCLLFIFML